MLQHSLSIANNQKESYSGPVVHVLFLPSYFPCEVRCLEQSFSIKEVLVECSGISATREKFIVGLCGISIVLDLRETVTKVD